MHGKIEKSDTDQMHMEILFMIEEHLKLVWKD